MELLDTYTDHELCEMGGVGVTRTIDTQQYRQLVREADMERTIREAVVHPLPYRHWKGNGS